MPRGKRFFNTVGVTNPEDHYFIPHRLDWKQLVALIEKKYYFVLHAPRQSGKTTAIIEFVKHLNEEQTYRALYLSTEPAHSSLVDVKEAIRSLLEEFLSQITIFLPNEQLAVEYLQKTLQKRTTSKSTLSAFLRFWAESSSKPLVIFFDEFDGLVGDVLIALLKQFRTGYTNRPKYFPQTICLVGIRDLRDYKVKTKQQEELGVLYSPFNIKAESLVLADFSLEDIKNLYGQHSKETGQIFSEEALEYAFEQTQGQPWLVNALAYQACFRDEEDRSIPITKESLERAREALIKRCDTHMDALLDRLNEPRVRHIIDSIISGGGEDQEFPADDLQYIQDLGLITKQGLTIANPIYQEIIPRALAGVKQRSIAQELSWYQKKDGLLDVPKLLSGFTAFYRENSEIWLEKFAYKEAGPHLLLLAFLQRIINGGGRIHREYALGSKRVDLLITWKEQKFVIELKVLRGEADISSWLAQIAAYMDKSHAKEGYLVIFDRRKTKSWEERIYQKEVVHQDKTISIWGM
ncbi:MAG: ATP-binding protein [Chlamydiae bacterium]|nr:ATP-binding protein [Chlamydiota bacterium]